MILDVTFFIFWIKRKRYEYSGDMVLYYDVIIEESKIIQPPLLAVFLLCGNGG